MQEPRRESQQTAGPPLLRGKFPPCRRCDSCRFLGLLEVFFVEDELDVGL